MPHLLTEEHKESQVRLGSQVIEKYDAHFDYSSLFSDAEVEKVGNKKKKKKKVKTERAIG
jgi:hypothetical protein